MAEQKEESVKQAESAEPTASVASSESVASAESAEPTASVASSESVASAEPTASVASSESVASAEPTASVASVGENQNELIQINFKSRAYEYRNSRQNNTSRTMNFYDNKYYKKKIKVNYPPNVEYDLTSKISLKDCYNLCLYLRNTPYRKLIINIDGSLESNEPYIWKGAGPVQSPQMSINSQVQHYLTNTQYYIANIYFSNTFKKCDIQPYIGGTISEKNILEDFLKELKQELSLIFSIEYLLDNFSFEVKNFGSKYTIEFTLSKNSNYNTKLDDLIKCLHQIHNDKKLHVLINLGSDIQVANTEFELITDKRWLMEKKNDCILGICLIKGSDINTIRLNPLDNLEYKTDGVKQPPPVTSSVTPSKHCPRGKVVGELKESRTQNTRWSRGKVVGERKNSVEEQYGTPYKRLSREKVVGKESRIQNTLWPRGQVVEKRKQY